MNCKKSVSKPTAIEPSRDVYETLARAPRQAIIAHLAGPTDETSLDELARAMAGQSGDTENVAIRLYHVHLPALDAAGLVHFNANEHTVRLSSDGRAIAAAMNPLDTSCT